MPRRRYLKTPKSVDDVEIWKENGEEEGIDFLDYRIHAIGVETFNPSDWSQGENLFWKPEELDIKELSCDDGLWFDFPDGHSTLSHVLEGKITWLGNKQKVVGAHVPQFLEILGLEIIKGNVNDNGVFEATVTKNGVPKSVPNHTMYPEHWGWDMVIDHFYGALVNAKYLGGNTFIGDYQLPGEKNVKIEIGFSTQDRTFRVTTFYPVVDKD